MIHFHAPPTIAILTNIEVRSANYTPKVTVTSATPTFANTPADQFNKLARDKGWTPPESFVAVSGMAGYQRDPLRRPAAAIMSFIEQVKQ
ncbi:hypothetical protein [Nocardia sp. NPDC003726]